MEIIPAIDIIGGKCVRLVKGEFERKKIYTPYHFSREWRGQTKFTKSGAGYSSDPLKIALVFQKAGLRRLHLIDLDGAKAGKVKNWQTIEKITQNTNLLIEFGGGIRNERDIKKLLDLGVDKIILGSLVLKEPEKFKKILKKFKEKIIVSVDVKQSRIYYYGWQKESKKELSSLLRDLIKLGLTTIICTDIEKDGTLKGPNFTLYKNLIKEFPNLKIIASGGIRNIKDLKKLSKIGAAGAIIGKALYENKISLNDSKNMRPKKIIACLDCYQWKGEWKVVKGVKFENLRLAGDPVKLAKIYSDEGTDELAMLDIAASQENRKPFFDLVEKVSKVIKIPLIVGGGISCISDIEKLLKLGVSKVSLNTAIARNPEFLNRAVKKFGSEKITVAIDVKKRGESWEVCILGGTKLTGLDAIEWAKEVERRGAGELLPTSKDKDGTKKGYDIELLRKLKENISIPIIASGGAGKKEDFLKALTEGRADAVLAAGIFHFEEMKISDLKKYLKQKGINVS